MARLNQKFGVLVAAAVLALAAAAPSVSWQEWLDMHGKLYRTTEEARFRRQVFETNVAIIDGHNAKAESHGWTMAVNKFADLTSTEFAARYASGRSAVKGSLRGEALPVATELLDVQLEALPTSVNWTAKGVVTPVKNQARPNPTVLVLRCASVRRAAMGGR